jgi:dynactin 1
MKTRRHQQSNIVGLSSADLEDDNSTSSNRWIYDFDDLRNMSDLQVGQIVELPDGRLATVRYIGETHFQTGDWVGVELEDNNGKNDGSVRGERYFDCEMGRGMFVRPTTITIVEQAPPPKPAAASVKKAARPSSVVSSGLGRRMSAVPDVGQGRRMSSNAASPSPAPKSRPSSLLRVRVISGSSIAFH